MHFTVSKALHIQMIESCQLVAGKQGLNRIIRSVSIMDTPDTTLLKKGDLLLTTGYVFKDDTDTQIKLIQELAKRGCAGLAIKVKRFLSSTPEAMLQEANRLNFPILEIPYDIALSDLLILYSREIFYKENLLNEQNRKNDFFTKLFIGEHSNRDTIVNQLQEYGMFLFNHFNILYSVVQNGSKPSSISSAEFIRLVSEVEAKINIKMLVVKLDDYIIIAQPLNCKCPTQLRSVVKEAATLLVNKFTHLFPNETIAVGIGNGRQDVLDIYSSFKEAKGAFQLGLQIRSKEVEKVYEYTELEPDILLQQLPDIMLNSYYGSTLEPLIRHDRENDTEYLRTLKVFLNNRGKIEETSRSLYLHRNTVKFRIARIEELLRIDLKNGDALFRVQLGVRVAGLLGEA
ncbi:PucR family transcriptional regulator [Metabacillus herbersteinensis]|uniref:PucR family transcriptional regulator n=1 Tax=Metabacillus herbersteinensis TaxID=283816 RepID=A0ABV6GG55_9BACI